MWLKDGDEVNCETGSWIFASKQASANLMSIQQTARFNYDGVASETARVCDGGRAN